MRTRIVPASEITAKKGLGAKSYIPTVKSNKVTYQVVIEVETTTELTAAAVDTCLSYELAEVKTYSTFWKDPASQVGEVPVKVRVLKAKVK